MKYAIIALLVAVVAMFIYSLMVVASRCSREEEAKQWRVVVPRKSGKSTTSLLGYHTDFVEEEQHDGR